MSKNSLGRELPEQVGSYCVRPYEGAYQPLPEAKPVVTRRTAGHRVPGGNKLVPTLEDAILASGLKDGMTISFHHSFREGDKVIGQVLTAIRALGIKGLRFAPSAVVNIKEPSIVDFVKDGTINRIEASGIRGQLGDAILSGEVELAEPVILRTHGGRPRAIEAGLSSALPPLTTMATVPVRSAPTPAAPWAIPLWMPTTPGAWWWSPTIWWTTPAAR